MKTLKSIAGRKKPAKMVLPSTRGGLLVRRGVAIPPARKHRDARRQARVNSRATLRQES